MGRLISVLFSVVMMSSSLPIGAADNNQLGSYMFQADELLAKHSTQRNRTEMDAAYEQAERIYPVVKKRKQQQRLEAVLKDLGGETQVTVILVQRLDTAVRIGDRIYFDMALARESDEIVRSCLAHELGHDRMDFWRKGVFAHSSLSASEESALLLELEKKADERATQLLGGTRELLLTLRWAKNFGQLPTREADIRIAALEGRQ